MSRFYDDNSKCKHSSVIKRHNFIKRGIEVIKKKTQLILFSFFAFFVSGCATIVGDSDQRIPFNSSPDNATVEIRDRNDRVIERRETPFSVRLDKSNGYFRSQQYTATFKKDGYSSQEVGISASPNGWYLAGNLFFGGLIGWFIVDPATGSMWTLSPDSVNTVLDEQVSLAEDENTVHVVLLSDVPDELRSEMKRVE